MRDAAYFASFVDEDARFINDTVIRGPSAMLEAWAPFFDERGPKIQWRPYYIEIAETGDLAFSRGPFRIRGVRDNGQTYESWGIYNSVWRKTGDASWNLIFDAGNQGENQLIEPMKKFIDEPVKNCDFQLDRKKRLG
jgi:ketosteroid isomerase-like protein